MSIRAGIKVDGKACPVVQAFDRADLKIRNINKTAIFGTNTITEEITLDGSPEIEPDQFSELYSTSDISVYEHTRERDKECVCDVVEQHLGRPVSDIQVRDDELYLIVHLEEIENLRPTTDQLRKIFDNVSVCKIDYHGSPNSEDTVFFDRSILTERQQEVYRAAHQSGYFDRNRQTNASDVAEELDIAVSTFSEHLNAAQAKIAEELFNGHSH